ncbi:MAG: hypothetical protein HYS06_00850, partial [Methylocystis sp.]|nr:hypothetical protein [Methylocystis sp.]
LVIAIATLMHVYVEAPSMALGKKLAARLSRAGRQPRPAFRESLPEALPPAGAPGAGEGSPVLERA